VIFTAAKLVNSLAILQGFYFAAQTGAEPIWFLLFSVYLYVFSVAEYCEGAFLLRGIHPGLRYFLLRGAGFALFSVLLLAALTGSRGGGPLLALLCGLLPLMAYLNGPSRESAGDLLFLLLSLGALALFSLLLWQSGPGLAFGVYMVGMLLAAGWRGRQHITNRPLALGPTLPNDLPEGTNLWQLAVVAIFVPAPRYMDLLFVQLVGAGQAEMAAAFGFRLANIAVRGPMFLYANYLPPRLGSLRRAFQGRVFLMAACAALAAFVICYGAIVLLQAEARPLPLALYALAICMAAYLGEILRFFARGGTLMGVSLLAPLLMIPLFWLGHAGLGLRFDVAFACSFCGAVVPLVSAAWWVEYRREIRL
jgi:hypothetical protein